MRIGPVAITAFVLAGACASCSGDDPTEPALPTVDFAATVELAVDDDAIACRRVDADDQPCEEVAAGDIVDVVNEGDGDHRLQADDGELFDTGILQPGDVTTIVITVPDDGPGEVEVRDVLGEAAPLTVTVGS